MGKRSRKRRRRRAPAGSGAPPAQPARRPRADPDVRPPAPWGSFPLVELVVLVALVLLVAGFVVQGEQGAVMLGTGLALGSLAGLELSVREHLAGYRSHTALLAAAAAVLTLAALFYLVPSLLPPWARLAVAALVAALAGWGLALLFRRRSGRTFKLR
jgi:hypothetical protein